MKSSHEKDSDLHGNVPDSCNTVLILIDVINDLRFPENREIVKKAAILGRSIAALKQRCRRVGIPTIYVNDNREKWRSDFRAVLSHCRGPKSLGRPLVNKLIPNSSDYIILKPKHSAFYATPLDTMLAYLKTTSVILAGLTTASCILLTAGEVYVRDLKLYVPSDCVAALSRQDHINSLELMRTNFQAITEPSPCLNLKRIIRAGSSSD